MNRRHLGPFEMEESEDGIQLVKVQTCQKRLVEAAPEFCSATHRSGHSPTSALNCHSWVSQRMTGKSPKSPNAALRANVGIAQKAALCNAEVCCPQSLSHLANRLSRLPEHFAEKMIGYI